MFESPSVPFINRHSPEYIVFATKRRFYMDHGEYAPILWPAMQIIKDLTKIKDTPGFDGFTEAQYEAFRLAQKAFCFVETIEAKRKGETVDNHTTTHYIWRTVGDNRVRSRHAAFGGQIFSWNETPPGGYHPGEDYGCRCWAEPHKPGEPQERVSQTVTSAVSDVLPAWTRADSVFYYLWGESTTVQLSDIGLLQKVIDRAREIVFPRVEAQIIEAARKNGKGSFPWNFRNSYDFKPAFWPLGRATLEGKTSVNVVDKGQFWVITADIDYFFSDTYTDILSIDDAVKYLVDHFEDLRDFPGKDSLKEFLEWLKPNPTKKPGEPPYGITESGIWDFPFTEAFDIIGSWTTRIEAVVKK